MTKNVVLRHKQKMLLRHCQNVGSEEGTKEVGSEMNVIVFYLECFFPDFSQMNLLAQEKSHWYEFCFVYYRIWIIGNCNGVTSHWMCTIFYVTDGNIMYLTDASRFLMSCVIQHYAPVVGWGGGGWRNRCIMLIMTLDPSWRQTLRLPPPGIEPGSHGS